jgi:hypothetical protein
VSLLNWPKVFQLCEGISRNCRSDPAKRLPRYKLAGEAGRAIGELKAQMVSQEAGSKSKGNAIGILTLVLAALAAIFSLVSGSLTAYTSFLLIRQNTLATEKAKKDLDLYEIARKHMSELESKFETFLFEEAIDPKTDPHQLVNDLTLMIKADRFGSATGAVRDFNDFIVA